VCRLKPIADFVHTITFDNGKEFARIGRKPEQLSADAGYCSEAKALENRDIVGYVATGRARDAVAGHLELCGSAKVSNSAPNDDTLTAGADRQNDVLILQLVQGRRRPKR
jgi:hypothetical protein